MADRVIRWSLYFVGLSLLAASAATASGPLALGVAGAGCILAAFLWNADLD